MSAYFYIVIDLKMQSFSCRQVHRFYCFVTPFRRGPLKVFLDYTAGFAVESLCEGKEFLALNNYDVIQRFFLL